MNVLCGRFGVVDLAVQVVPSTIMSGRLVLYILNAGAAEFPNIDDGPYIDVSVAMWSFVNPARVSE